LLQHARAAARFDAEGALVLLDDQDRSLWNQKMIAGVKSRPFAFGAQS